MLAEIAPHDRDRLLDGGLGTLATGPAGDLKLVRRTQDIAIAEIARRLALVAGAFLGEEFSHDARQTDRLRLRR
jgi:hypothetical protein